MNLLDKLKIKKEAIEDAIEQTRKIILQASDDENNYVALVSDIFPNRNILPIMSRAQEAAQVRLTLMGELKKVDDTLDVIRDL